jgi:hypothetical protein
MNNIIHISINGTLFNLTYICVFFLELSLYEFKKMYPHLITETCENWTIFW